MWSDNETVRDLVNFSHVAEIAAERIVGARGEPLSIGISGDWGVGKSSMMKLLRVSLQGRTDLDVRFVEFNAWLYQNYDDARAALMEAITASIVDHAVKHKETLTEKTWVRVSKLFGRVKKLRVLGLLGTAALDYYTHGHATGLLAGGMAAFGGVTDGSVSAADVDKVKSVATEALKGGKELLDEKPTESADDDVKEETPRKAIQAFRDDLEASLSEMGITLVVLIDDLDRCLPKTAIATLEAMRLFLFLKHTAFVIAADEGMIRQAVRTHFEHVALSDDLVTNYFDKLIQLPIRVPPLGTQEVRAYLMMLFVDADPDLSDEQKEAVRGAVCKRLAETWKGTRVDKAFVAGEIADRSPGLLNRLALAERIAPILTTSPTIRGNPRLIKRFLNTLTMRVSMARLQNVQVDEEVLVKLLLFERSGDRAAFAELLRAVNESDDGRAGILADLEAVARGEQSAPAPEKPWNDQFLQGWLAMDPPLAALDLRGALYVGRENNPIISRADELSSDGASVLEMLLRLTSASPTVDAEVAALPSQEVAKLTDRVLARARQETSWGTPAVLNAMQSLAAASPPASASIVAFLADVPVSQVKPSIVPRLSTTAWGRDVLAAFAGRAGMPTTVQKAITASSKGAA